MYNDLYKAQAIVNANWIIAYDAGDIDMQCYWDKLWCDINNAMKQYLDSLPS